MCLRHLAVLVAIAVLAPLGASAATPNSGYGDPTDQPLHSGSAKATLRVVGSAPLSLRGSGFHRGELVRIGVTTGKEHFVRQKRAAVTGAFAVSFAGVTFDPCGTPPEITARGARTGPVSVRMLPRDCAMP